MKNCKPPQFILGEVVAAIGKTSKYVDTLIRNAFQDNDIPLSKEQFIVLLRIEEEPKPQSFLAVVTERDKGSLTRLVQSLEKNGFVNRKNCKHDQRVNNVGITPKGRALLTMVKPMVKQIYDLVQADVKQEERETALKVLSQIQANAAKEIQKIDRLN